MLELFPETNLQTILFIIYICVLFIRVKETDLIVKYKYLINSSNHKHTSEGRLKLRQDGTRKRLIGEIICIYA